MASNNSNNAGYGTMQSEKDKLPLYNTSSRTSTDSTASTDALLQRDSKKGSSDKEKDKVSAKALLNSKPSSPSPSPCVHKLTRDSCTQELLQDVLLKYRCLVIHIKLHDKMDTG